ncbi:MAG TPA: hypothetical protein VL051_02885 [Burkholderiaceae bacterium]|nr:hypothetical protein [Burkholderiaceae bacterium]
MTRSVLLFVLPLGMNGSVCGKTALLLPRRRRVRFALFVYPFIKLAARLAVLALIKQGIA